MIRPLFFLALSGTLSAQRPTVTIPRVDRPPPPVMDSLPGWGAVVSDFRQREPGDGVPVSRATTAYLGYDDANLYVVFVCRDEPAKVRANVARREDIGDDDQVAVYLDTFRDRKRAYVFVVNPLGVQRDGILTEGQGEDLSFDAVWRSDGHLTDSGYVVRMTIPFRALRFSGQESQVWGIALQRIIQRENEEAFWPHLTKRVNGLVAQFTTADGLSGIAPGRNAQVTPYSVMARARVLDDDIPGYVQQGDERVGMDAKAVIGGAFTVDATVNPDFSQVETDDPQVTLNQRFEVFLPEKRPFFLENAGYFQTPVNLFFSRRIADPGAGIRITGKTGRWAIGALAMNDRAAVPAGDPSAGLDTWAGAVRVQRDVGEESSVGLLVTGREFFGGRRADRMYAADGRFRAGDHLAFTTQVMRSETWDTGGTPSTSWGALGDLSFETRSISYGTKYYAFGPDFAAPLGFVSRVGYRRSQHELELTVRPGGPITQFGPTVSANLLWDHQTGALLDREIEGAIQMEMRGNTELAVARTAAFERFDGIIFRPSATRVEVSTEWLKWLTVEGTYTWGTAVNHDPADTLRPTLERAYEAELGVVLRPTPRLRFEQAISQAELRTAGNARIVRERQMRVKLHYQFTRYLSLRAIVDWEGLDADTTLADESGREREWRGDLLLTFLTSPGTAIYLGYTDRYENLVMMPGAPPELVRGRSPNFSVGRQIFVKVSYLFTF